MMIEIHCVDPGSLRDDQLTYVVMGTRVHGKWIFVRHRERTTWELPAGHIERGETAEEAAIRELREEAGVVRCSMCEVCDYSVTVDGIREFGRLYMVRVEGMVPGLHHEIAELQYSTHLPGQLTYPVVQPVLFERITAFYSD